MRSGEIYRLIPKRNSKKIRRLSRILLMPLQGDGKNVRDWLYVDDHTAAILSLLEKAETGGVYAISRGEEFSNLEIAGKILKILNKSKDSFEDQLKKTIAWYRENANWVYGVLNKSNDINKHIKIN